MLLTEMLLLEAKRQIRFMEKIRPMISSTVTLVMILYLAVREMTYSLAVRATMFFMAVLATIYTSLVKAMV